MLITIEQLEELKDGSAFILEKLATYCKENHYRPGFATAVMAHSFACTLACARLKEGASFDKFVDNMLDVTKDQANALRKDIDTTNNQ